MQFIANFLKLDNIYKAVVIAQETLKLAMFSDGMLFYRALMINFLVYLLFCLSFQIISITK